VAVPVEVEDEIGFLTRSFNGMVCSIREAEAGLRSSAEALKVSNEQLADTNRTLEQRVAERTRDLSDRNEALEKTLERLRQTQNQLIAQERMASVGQIAAGITHEINSPVGAINGFADVSSRCADRIQKAVDRSATLGELKASEVYVGAVSAIKENAWVTAEATKRITGILKGLSNFIQLDGAEYRPVDLHEGIDAAIGLLEHRVRDRIAVEKRYGDLPKVRCAPGRMNQVFFAVLRNAVDAVRQDGTITVVTATAGDRVRVGITDSGIGMTQKQIERLFDIGFSDAGGRVKMGSGLFVAHSIVQDHEGSIRAWSQPGEGTTVEIVLPVAGVRR
jgi:signal transduction histidine kinase